MIPPQLKLLPVALLAGSLAVTVLGADPVVPPADAGATPGSNPKFIDQETRELKVRDGLSFTIAEDPSKGSASRIEVNDLGDAKFPVTANGSEYINIKVAGRKLSDVRLELKQRLEEEYYKVATISLDVLGVFKETSSGPSGSVAKVIIYGSHNQTIPLPETGKMTLSEVFARVGRIEFANLKKVEVFRWDPKAQKLLPPVTKNVKKMLDTGDLSEDIELNDGDRIKVVERTVIF